MNNIDNNFTGGQEINFSDETVFILKYCAKIILLLTFLFAIKNLRNIYLKVNLVYLNPSLNNNKDKNRNISQRIKIALCTIGKKENLYAKEFIEYYFNLGVNHIFIYDDNIVNDEKIYDIIPSKYILNISTYFTYEKNITHQSQAFSDCYKNNFADFDWFIMVDMDEYLYIVNNTLEGYLTSPNMEKCDFIKINWLLSRDNDLLYYDSKSLFDRFKPPYLKSKFIKSIIRGNISDLKYWVHSPIYSPYKNITCNSEGKQIYYKVLNFEKLTPINIEKAFIIHFRFKSTQELVNKNKRGFGSWLDNQTLEWTLKGHINDYFEHNKITLEKIKYIEKNLKIKLYYHRIKVFLSKFFF